MVAACALTRQKARPFWWRKCAKSLAKNVFVCCFWVPILGRVLVLKIGLRLVILFNHRGQKQPQNWAANCDFFCVLLLGIPGATFWQWACLSPRRIVQEGLAPLRLNVDETSIVLYHDGLWSSHHIPCGYSTNMSQLTSHIKAVFSDSGCRA